METESDLIINHISSTTNQSEKYVSGRYFHNGLHKKHNMLNPLAKASVGGSGTETRQNKQRKKSQKAQSDKIWFKCKKKKKCNLPNSTTIIYSVTSEEEGISVLDIAMLRSRRGM